MQLMPPTDPSESTTSKLSQRWTRIETLPARLFTAEVTRNIDRHAIEQLGIPAIQLMKRAGRAAFQLLQARWPALADDNQVLSVVCGKGNNAGDGYIVAMLAVEHGWRVEVYELAAADTLSPTAQQARTAAISAGVRVQEYTAGLTFTSGVIVDAILGTGARGTLAATYAEAIRHINASALPVLALDVPSGIDSDTGAALRAGARADVDLIAYSAASPESFNRINTHRDCVAIVATATITFIALKRGLMTADAVDHVGELICADLSLPAAVTDPFAEAGVERLQLNRELPRLSARPVSAHKNRFGHVLVIGGNHGMAGAALLAARSALRTGSGLVSVATRTQHVSAFVAAQAELMTHAVEDRHALFPLLEKADAVVLGPGLGRCAWAQQMTQACLQFFAEQAEAGRRATSQLLDADALNLLASMGRDARRLPANTIITPHPAEAARLLQTTTVQIQADRFAAAEALATEFAAVSVLKGAGTIVASPPGLLDDLPLAALSLCPYGNPGMATAGMGDVLSGILGGLLAQGLAISDAAHLGVCLHAAAGDVCAQAQGQRGMAAGDVLPYVRQLLNNDGGLCDAPV